MRRVSEYRCVFLAPCARPERMSEMWTNLQRAIYAVLAV